MADILAIDIGGTKIAAAIVRQQKAVARTERATPSTADAVVEAIVDTARAFPAASHAAVAATGIVRDGRIEGPNRSTILGWENVDLKGRLERELGFAVTLLNDAQAAAWGEFRAGTDTGSRSMIYVTVSTGVGAGIIVDGTLLKGSRDLAGHFGHTVVDPAGPACGCGRTGCIEAVASGRALERSAEAAFGQPITTRQLLAMADGGNRRARLIATEAARFLAAGLTNLAVLIDPEAIVLGGGLGSNASFRRLVVESLRAEPQWCSTDIRRAALGRDAPLIGAALTAEAELATLASGVDDAEQP